MKKLIIMAAVGLLAAIGLSTRGGSLNNPGWPQTNVVYAATAGYAHTGGTSVVATATEALLVVETNRAKTAETVINTNLTALLIAETNRAQVAENVINTNLTALLVAETNRAQVAENVINTNLMALLVAETNRAQVAEGVLAGRILAATNSPVTLTFITAITTNETGGVTAYLTTNLVLYTRP